jgi:HEPN domain-containing protein
MHDPDEVKLWIKRAEHDFKDATVFLRQRESFARKMVCFHCQQTAEKYLKAFLVLHETAFPKVHDLRRLLRLCIKFEPALEAYRDAFELLRPYSVHYEPPIDEAEAGRAVEAVTKIRNVMREFFPSEFLQTSDQ